MRSLVLFLMTFPAIYGTIMFIEHFGLEGWYLIITLTVGAVVALIHGPIMKFFDRFRSVDHAKKE